MKHLISVIILLALTLSLTACQPRDTALDPLDPVTLTMWHVSGEQADSPMNRLVDAFNSTVGLDRGVLINVTLMTIRPDIGP